MRLNPARMPRLFQPLIWLIVGGIHYTQADVAQTGQLTRSGSQKDHDVLVGDSMYTWAGAAP
jgi:hypothetical protein